MKNATSVWAIAVVLSLSTSPVLGWIDFHDGQIHDIDYQTIDHIRVDYLTPGMQTTVNLLDGGRIISDLFAYENSYINILGGAIDWDLYAWDNSHVNFSGGSIGLYLFAEDSSHIDISGGSIGHSLSSSGNSQVDISGGSIGDSVLALFDQSKIQIFGCDFSIDGIAVGYGELTSIFGGSYNDEPMRHLTGTLASGELINSVFYIGHDAKITLVPEPATLLLLGLATVMVRKRR